MTTALNSPTPQIKMTHSLAGKTRGELIEMYQELTNLNFTLWIDYNQNFFISPSYDAAYLRERQAILDQMKPIQEALEPAYLEECNRERTKLAAA